MFETIRAALSDPFVASVPTPTTGECRVWDLNLTGFMVRVWPTGRKVFCLRLRRDKRTELHTIGKFQDPWTTETARQAAEKIIGRLCSTSVTARDRKAGRNSTVNELCDRYLSEGRLTKITKRPGSWKTDATNLRRHVQRLIGHRRIDELVRTDIERMIQDITDGVTAGDIKTKRQGVARVRGGAGSAARVKITLCAMFNWAVLHELMDRNPAMGIKVAKARLVERILSDKETERLLEVLSELTQFRRLNVQHANVIRLLLFTGARKSEILGLRWSEVDLLRSRLTLPPERTKCGQHNGFRRIPLGSAAKEILAGISRDSDYVFPADRPGNAGYLTGIQKTWKHICAKCGFENVRLHDLRHTFASFAIINGESIYLVSQVLGHSTTRMTERYLHLRDEDTRGVAERTAQKMLKSGSRLRVVAASA